MEEGFGKEVSELIEQRARMARSEAAKAWRDGTGELGPEELAAAAVGFGAKIRKGLEAVESGERTFESLPGWLRNGLTTEFHQPALEAMKPLKGVGFVPEAIADAGLRAALDGAFHAFVANETKGKRSIPSPDAGGLEPDDVDGPEIAERAPKVA